MICCGFYHKDRARVEFWAIRKMQDDGPLNVQCDGFRSFITGEPTARYLVSDRYHGGINPLGSGWLAIIQQEG